MVSCTHEVTGLVWLPAQKNQNLNHELWSQGETLPQRKPRWRVMQEDTQLSLLVSLCTSTCAARKSTSNTVNKHLCLDLMNYLGSNGPTNFTHNIKY